MGQREGGIAGVGARPVGPDLGDGQRCRAAGIQRFAAHVNMPQGIGGGSGSPIKDFAGGIGTMGRDGHAGA